MGSKRPRWKRVEGRREGAAVTRRTGRQKAKPYSRGDSPERRSPLCCILPRANTKHVVPLKKDGFRKLQYYDYYY